LATRKPTNGSHGLGSYITTCDSDNIATNNTHGANPLCQDESPLPLERFV